MTKPKLSAAAEPLVLGIESSCDETGIGIVRGTRLLTNTVSSSMEEHVRFGGVIPEIASRAHLDAMIPALEAALADAYVTLDDIDAIAVTAGPGLAGALMVGVSAAKALATATGKPLYGINHLVAHVGVGLLDDNGTEDGSALLEHARDGSGHCWFLVVTPKFCRYAILLRMFVCSEPPLMMPPVRPTIKSLVYWDSITREAPLLTAPRARGMLRRLFSHAGCQTVSSWVPPKPRGHTGIISRFQGSRQP